jgi:hypothetical protein
MHMDSILGVRKIPPSKRHLDGLSVHLGYQSWTKGWCQDSPMPSHEAFSHEWHGDVTHSIDVSCSSPTVISTFYAAQWVDNCQQSGKPTSHRYLLAAGKHKESAKENIIPPELIPPRAATRAQNYIKTLENTISDRNTHILALQLPNADLTQQNTSLSTPHLSAYGEMVRLLYILNMLVLACCGNNTKTTQTISYHSQRTRAILGELGSGTVNNATSTMRH